MSKLHVRVSYTAKSLAAIEAYTCTIERQTETHREKRETQSRAKALAGAGMQ